MGLIALNSFNRLAVPVKAQLRKYIIRNIEGANPMQTCHYS
jgi:hypothetical protein